MKELGRSSRPSGMRWRAQDIERAASLVERVALGPLLQQSEVLLVRRLVERLPVLSSMPDRN